MAGLTEVGQRALDEARRLASSRPSCVTPEIDRLAAALLLQAGGEPAAAERHLRTALAIARDPRCSGSRTARCGRSAPS
jgi:hypothetical protein